MSQPLGPDLSQQKAERVASKVTQKSAKYTPLDLPAPPEPLNPQPTNIQQNEQSLRELVGQMRRDNAHRENNAWVTDREADSLAGGTVNMVNRLGQSVFNLTNQAITTVDGRELARIENAIPEELNSVLQRWKNGEELSPEEVQLLQTPSIDLSRTATPHRNSTSIEMIKDVVSPIEAYQRAYGHRKNIQGVDQALTGEDSFFQRSFNNAKRQNLDGVITTEWERVKPTLSDKGLSDPENIMKLIPLAAKLASKGALDHPQAMLEYFVEDMAQTLMSINPTGMVTSAGLMANQMSGQDRVTSDILRSDEKIAERNLEIGSAAAIGTVGDHLVNRLTGVVDRGTISKMEDAIRRHVPGRKVDAPAPKPEAPVKSGPEIQGPDRPSTDNVRYDAVEDGPVSYTPSEKPVEKPKAESKPETTEAPKPDTLSDKVEQKAKSTAKNALKAAAEAGFEAASEGYESLVEADAVGEDFDLKEDGLTAAQGATIGLGASATPGMASAAARGAAKLPTVAEQAGKILQEASDNMQAKKATSDKEKASWQADVDQAVSDGNSTDLIKKSIAEMEKNEKFDLADNIRSIAARHEQAVQNNDKATADKVTEAFDSAYVDIAEAYQSAVAAVGTALHDGSDEATQKKLRAKAERFSKAMDEINQIDEVIVAANERFTKTSDAVKGVVQAENRDEQFEVFAQKIFDTDESSPSAISIEQMESLLTSTHWTPQERKRIQSSMHLKETLDINTLRKIEGKNVAIYDHVSENTNINDVAMDVYYGRKPGTRGPKDKGATGAKDYLRQIKAALKTGDQKKALATRKKLARFAERQRRKADDFNEAYAPFLRVKQGGRLNISPDEQEAIDHVNAYYPSKATESGGIEITPSAVDLVAAVQTEALILEAALAHADSIVDHTATTVPDASTPDAAAAVVADMVGDMDVEETQNTEATATPQAARSTVTDVTPESDAAAERVVPDEVVSFDDATQQVTPDETTPQVEAQSDSVSADTPKQTQKAAPVRDDDARTRISEDREIVSNLDNQIKNTRAQINDERGLAREARKRLGLPATGRLRGTDNQKVIDLKNAIKEDLQFDLEDLLAQRKDIQQDRRETEGRTGEFNAADEILGLYPNAGLAKRFVGNKVRSIFREVGNVIQQLKRVPETILTYQRDGTGKLTPEQIRAIDHFTSFAPGFSKVINNMLPEDLGKDFINGQPRDNYYHLMLTKDGKYTDAALAAMSMAAYNWVANEARDTLSNEKSTIASMFALNNEDEVTHELEQYAKHIGVRKTWLARSLGKEVRKMLGLALNKETGAPQHESQLEMQLGLAVLAAMEETGFVQRQTHKYADVLNAMPDTKDYKGALIGTKNKIMEGPLNLRKDTAGVPQGDFDTYVVPQNLDVPLYDENRMADRPNEIYKANKGTNRILQEVLGQRDNPSMPSFKPIEDLPLYMKKTVKKLPEKLKQTLLKEQARPKELSPDTDRLMNALGDDDQLAIIGVVGDAELARMPIRQRESAKAKNDGLQRELEIYNDFRDHLALSKNGLQTSFYLPMTVWNYGRIGYTSAINPQTSKVHRGLIGQKEWRRPIKLDNQNDVNKFLIGVAQGFDIDIDKMTEQAALYKLQSLLDSDPRIEQAALDAISLAQQELDPTSPEGIAARANIVAVVKKGKLNTHTLRALTNLGRYLEASEDPDATQFTSDLWVELDGVTNGVAIGTMLYTNGTVQQMMHLLKKGGFMFDENRSLGSLIDEMGQRDFYLTLADAWTKELQDRWKKLNAKSPDAERIALMQSILMNGSTIPRALAKEPLMQNVYGAGKDSILNILGEEFLDKIDDRLAKIAQIEDGHELKRAMNQLNSDLKNITGFQYDFYKLKPGMKSTDILNMRLSDKQADRIKQVVAAELGGNLIDAIDANFAAFKGNRKVYVGMMQKLNTAFANVFEKKLEHARLALVREGKLDKNDPAPKALYNEILEQLHEVMPSVGNLYAENADEQLQSTGLEKASLTRTVKGKEVPVQATVKYNSKRLKNNSISAGVQTDQIKQEIGVGSGVQNIHGFDAAMATHLLNTLAAFNVHDGFPVAVLDAIKAGKALNEEMATKIGTLNPYQFLGDTVKRMTDYFDELVDEGLIDKEEAQSMYEAMTQMDPENEYDVSTLANLDKLAKSQQRKTRYLLKHLQGLVQYNYEGGIHITERGQQVDNGETLPFETPTHEPEVKAVEAKKPESTTAGKQRTEQMKKAKVQPDNKPKYTPEQRATAFQRALEKVLGETSNAKEALNKLFPQDRNAVSMTTKMLKALAPAIPEDLNIQLILDVMEFEDTPELMEHVQKSRGFYVADEKTIYLRSSLFDKDGTNPETLAHELVHALTVHTMAGVRSGEITDKKAIKAVEKLDALHAELKAQLDSGKFPSKFANALVNAEEMVAWGMTNKEFSDALAKARVKIRQQNSLVNAFDRLLNLIKSVVFRDVKAPKSSALKQLVELGVATIEADNRLNPRATTVKEVFYQRIERMKPSELIEALAKRDAGTTDEHLNHLKNVQSTLVDAVAGPLGLDLAETESALGDEVDQYLNHLYKGTRPFTSKLREVFPLKPAELYVAEQVEAVLGNSLSESGFVRRELKKSWDIAKAGLKVEDFLPFPEAAKNPSDMKRAQAMYNYLFEPEGYNSGRVTDDSVAGKRVDNRQADYLQRFAVLGSTYKPLMDKLAELDNRTEAKGEEGSFIKRFNETFMASAGRMTELLNGNTRVSGSVLDAQNNLLQRLARTNYEQRRKLSLIEEKEQGLRDAANRKVSGAIKKVMNGKAYQALKDTDIALLSAPATMLQMAVNDRVGAYTQLIRDKFRSEKAIPGAVSSIADEIRGNTPNNQHMIPEVRKTNRDVEQARRFTKESLSRLIRDGFKNKLTEARSMALTKVLVKTDAATLLHHGYSMADIDRFLSDEKTLTKEIGKLESKLMDGKHGEKYIAHARDLAWYMNHNIATSHNLIKNAYGIARLFGYKTQVSDVDAANVEGDIDVLTSLQAMAYTEAGNRAVAQQVVREEASNGKGDAAEYLLRQYQALREESQMSIFDDDPALMTKGFISEIHNPHISLAWAETGSVTARNLEAQGYRKVSVAIPRDRLIDNDKSVSLYAIEDGGMVRRVTGSISLTDMAAKGTDFMESAFMTDNTATLESPEKVLGAMSKNAMDAAETEMTLDFDPSKVKDPRYIPVFNPDGSVTKYRYEASENMRAEVLQKQYDVGEVVGGIAGNIVDKTNTRERNRQVVDALYEQWTNDENRAEKGYVIVGPNARDPQIREYWALLPLGTREYVIDKFGKAGLPVQRDVLRMTFGYRKASVRDLWTKDPETLNGIQKVIKASLENTLGRHYGERLPVVLRNAENGVEEVMKMVKDTFVVKSMFTMLFNTISNFAFLIQSDVPVVHAATDMVEGWRETYKYNDLKKKRFKLERDLAILPDADTAGIARIQRQLTEVQTEMAANPVHELMEAGLFQTIVEDIDTAKDPFSYKSRFLKSMEGTLQNKHMGLLNEFGKQLFVAQDTKLYKLLNEPIQMGDFAARYAQYKYMTKTSKKPISRQEALERVERNFVNYDLPTHPGLQYLNDVGGVLFTKYALRIQRPLYDLFLEKPATMLMNTFMMGGMGIPSPMDASIVNSNPLDKFTTPVHSAVDAWDEALPFNAMLHAIQLKD